MKKRTLYECQNARVGGEHIYCREGYRLSSRTEDGSLHIRQLERGAALALKICQECPEFDSMGSPIPKGERGWK